LQRACCWLSQADAIDVRLLSQRMPEQAIAELQPLVAAFN